MFEGVGVLTKVRSGQAGSTVAELLTPALWQQLNPVAKGRRPWTLVDHAFRLGARHSWIHGRRRYERRVQSAETSF